MDKLQVVKCNCGDDGCTIHGLSTGNFPQGAGFHSKEQAQAVCDAVNNTSGLGIDPNAVPGLLEIVNKVIEIDEDALTRTELEAMFSSLVGKAKKAIKSAELK